MDKTTIIKTLRDMAKYPTVTMPRDTEALRNAADLLEQAEQAQPVAQIHCSEKRKPGGCQLHNLHCGWPKCNEPQKQEQAQPVAYGMWDTMLGKSNRMMMVRLDKGQDGCTVPLYTSPPPRQPLTDEQIKQIELSLRQYNSRDTYDLSLNDFARAIEAACTKGEA